jgi:hypothetical protein
MAKRCRGGKYYTHVNYSSAKSTVIKATSHYRTVISLNRASRYLPWMYDSRHLTSTYFDHVKCYHNWVLNSAVESSFKRNLKLYMSVSKSSPFDNTIISPICIVLEYSYSAYSFGSTSASD